MPRVAVCIPSGTEIKSDTSMTLCTMVGYSLTKGIEVFLLNEKSCYVTQNRNKLVSDSLKHDPTHLLWLDSDMVCPPDTLVRLLEHGKDIVGATYSKKGPPYGFLGHSLPGASPGALMEYEALPFGMVLVKADVFRKLKWPWFYETYHRDKFDPDTDPRNAFFEHLEDTFLLDIPPEVRHYLGKNAGLMSWVLNASKQRWRPEQEYPYIGEDYHFCLKAKRYGFQVWCDTELSFKTGHIGDQIFACRKAEKLEAA